MFGQFSLNHQYWVWFHWKACSRASPTVTQVFYFFIFLWPGLKIPKKMFRTPPPLPHLKTFDSSAGTECIVLCCWVSGCGDFVRFPHRLLILLIFLFIPCYWWSLIIKSPQINTAWLIPTGEEPQLFSFFFFSMGREFGSFSSGPHALPSRGVYPTNARSLQNVMLLEGESVRAVQ